LPGIFNAVNNETLVSKNEELHKIRMTYENLHFLILVAKSRILGTDCPLSGEIIGITWVEGQIPPSIFIPPKSSFWQLSQRQANKRIGVRLEERGVCILRTDSKQSSPLSNFIHTTLGQFPPSHVISQITPMGEIADL
jgi:hypothetical protein